MLELRFPCPLTRGLHARPASALQSLAQRYRSTITMENLRNNKVANVRSVFSLVGAEIRSNDPCRLRVHGPDQDQAFQALRSLIEKDLAESDRDEAKAAPGSQDAALPHSLRIAEPVTLAGIPLVRALAWARLHVGSAAPLPEHLDVGAPEEPALEQARFDRARDRVAEQIRRRIHSSRRSTEGQILAAHLGMLEDEEFTDRIRGSLSLGNSVAEAVLEAARHYGQTLRGSEIALIRERVLDLEDVCRQLLREAYGTRVLPSEAGILDVPSILAVDSLTPSAFLALDRENLKGLLLGDAGTTSHTVVLARGRGLATLTGVNIEALRSRHGQEVILDGTLGILVLEPHEAVKCYYRLEQVKHAQRQARIQASMGSKAESLDGQRIDIGANISCSEEAALAFEHGADGIGLFRTEMLFMDRDAPPDEQEQSTAYREVLRAAAGRPVIFRTLDLGGDKDVPYLGLDRSEDNPLLGCRGVRLYQVHESLFRAQLAALLGAAAAGEPWIMVPMISSLDEVLWVKSVLSQVRAERTQAGQPCPRSVRLGAMIETPAAAAIVDQLCLELDFFSIGTNDLTQYVLAVDRTSAGSGRLYSGHHPAVIRTIRRVAEEAHARGKWVGVCGEMASDPVNLPLWLGLGLEEISVAPAGIAGLKAEARGVLAQEARALVPALAECLTDQAVRDRLGAARQQQGRLALLDARMVGVGVEVPTKALALKALADLLYVEGRTDDPAAVENALWARELAYSTGLGQGFAVPHCQSGALNADTIAVLKLARPIDWDSLDGQPVSVVILLARREGSDKRHLQVLARLARSLMQDAFREFLTQEDSPQRIAEFLGQKLMAP
jgi:phosphoenolpyruvate-protein phosphotransferase